MFDIDDGTFATFTDDDGYSDHWTDRSYCYRNNRGYTDAEKKKWWKKQVNSTIVPKFICDTDLKYAALKFNLNNKLMVEIANKKTITELERKMIFYSIKRKHSSNKSYCDDIEYTIVNEFPRLFFFSLALEELLMRFNSLGCRQSDFIYVIEKHKNTNKDDVHSDMRKILKL